MRTVGMVKIFLMMAMLLAFSACGDDSSSSTKPADSEADSSSGTGSSSSKGPKKAKSVVDDEAKDMRLSDKPEDGVVVDTNNGATYKTRTLGIFTWTTENVNVKDLSVKSTCYAYNDANCKPYGRLYMNNNAENACPEGYKIPTVSDLRFIKQQDSSAFAYAGTCFKNDSLECSGIGESAQYLAYGDSAVVIDTSGRFSPTMARGNGFYSLLCIKYRTIVENETDLPECKKKRFYNYPTIYVANSDADFTCDNGEWESSKATGPCGAAEEGEKYVINELVFICKNGHWRWTTPKESGVECTKKNLYEEFIVNSFRYACTDSGLVKLAFPATELGLCYSKREGEVGNTDSVSYYICDGEFWKNASVSDVLGKCDSTNKGESGMFKGMSYTCHSSTWNLTTIDDILGDCTAKRQGEIKEYEDGFVTCHGKNWVTSQQIELDFGGCTEKLQDSVREDDRGYLYACKNGYWLEKDSDEILGVCQTDNNGTIRKYGPNAYVCTDYAWDPLDALDSALGNCTKENYTDKSEYKGVTYFCKYSNQFEWSKATEEEERMGYCPNKQTFTTEIDGVSYKCNFGTWEPAEQSDVLPYCATSEGTTKVFNGIEYVCDTTAYNKKGNWFPLTSIDSALGDYCRTSILNKAELYDNVVYICSVDSADKNKKIWREGIILDYMGECNKSRNGEKMYNGLDTCVCKDPEWKAIIRDSITDGRDSQVYGIVTLGTQKWLNRNLEYWISTAYSNSGRHASPTPDFDETNYYTWEDAINSGSNLCPNGFHIPSKAEWKTLFSFADSIAPSYGIRALIAPGDFAYSFSGYDLYGLGLRRLGYIDMDLYPKGNDPRSGLRDNKILYYWVSGEEDATVVSIDTTFNIQYKTNIQKEDAYLIHCIMD